MSLDLEPQAPEGAYEARAKATNELAEKLRRLIPKLQEIARRRRGENKEKPRYLAPFGWLLPLSVLFLIGSGGGGTNAQLTPGLGRPGTIVGVGRKKFL